MTRRGLKTILALSLLGAILAGLLFSGYDTAANTPGWLRMVNLEIQAACRDAATQWMVVICLLSYLIVFLFLEKRFKFQVSSFKSESESEAQSAKSPSSILHPPSSTRQNAISDLLTAISSPNFWLGAFVVLVLLRYAFDYAAAAKSLQVVVLLTGLVVGKGVALWVGWSGSPKSKVQSLKLGETGARYLTPALSPFEAERESAPSSILHLPSSSRRLTILCIVTFLLAVAALWQPERGMGFQYRGQRRWTGVWDNPNLYGVLMGVGTILAVGFVVQSLKSKGQGRGTKVESREPEEVGRVTPCAPEERQTFNLQLSTCNAAYWLKLVFFLSATVLCAYGLLKSYSRGAWLGTAVGISFLIWKWINREPPEICESQNQSDSPLPVQRGEGNGAHGVTRPTSPLSRIWRISRLKGYWFPSSLLILSILVICFWQFRQTESPVARRVFSVGNPNDFSWRNRVAAWEGAGRMILAKPIIGFGWGKAEEIYGKEYRAARLEESAAVQLNDYLMIGISAGGPALICLLIFLWLAMRPKGLGRGSPLPAALVTDTNGAHGVTRPTINSLLPTIAASGAVVLVIGFWFDGGLFKLPTCAVFWVLVELARGGGLITKLASQARHDIVALDQKNRSRGCVVTKHTKSGNGISGSFFRVFRVFRGSKELSHLPVSSQALPSEPEEPQNILTAKYPKYAKAEITLRWLAGLFAVAAFGLTALHLGTPQLAVSERTLSLARKFIVPPKEQTDFEYLAAKNIWSNTPLKTLLQHAHLANYNRTLVNWKLEDQLYREFVLSPEISPAPGLSATRSPSDGEGGNAALVTDTNGAPGVTRPTSQPSTRHGWRRPLWEYFYPRIRKESSLEAAAEIIVRQLRERISITSSSAENSKLEIQNSKSGGKQNIAEIWRRQMASDAEFARLAVAALRSAGIPARISVRGPAEFWNGAEWKPAPRPVEAKGK